MQTPHLHRPDREGLIWHVVEQPAEHHFAASHDRLGAVVGGEIALLPVKVECEQQVPGGQLDPSPEDVDQAQVKKKET